MRKPVILLIIGLLAGASSFFCTVRDISAAGDPPHYPASAHTRSASGPSMNAVLLNKEINEGGNRASLDLKAWHLENQGRPLYDNNSFRFSTFRFQHEQESVRAAVGDLSVQSSELIAPSLSRRGALLGFEKTGYSAEAFTMRNSPVSGLGYGFGQPESSQILIGGRITHTILEDRDMRFIFHYLDGRGTDPTVYGIDPETPRREGTAYSTALESRIAGNLLRFYGELCYSRYDEKTEDSSETAADKAWKVKLFGSAKRFSYAVGYKYLGGEFRTVANPDTLNNRDEIFADTQYRMDSSSVTFSVFQARDNVEDTDLAPLAVYRTAKIGYKLGLAGWPVLFVNQSLSTRRSIDEPAGCAAVDAVTRTTYFGISYEEGIFDLMPSYSITSFTDRTMPAGGGDSLTHTARLSCGITPQKWISLKPVFIYKNYLLKESDVRITTYQGSLDSTVQIIPHTLTINTSLSYLEKKADDGSTGITEKRAGYQLSWNIKQYLRKMGAKSLAFMGEVVDVQDRSEELSTKKYTISLMASIGLPFDQLEYQSQSSRFPREMAF